MSHKNPKEIVASVLLIILLGAFLDPFGTSMPDAMKMLQLAGTIVVFAIFAAFVWKERSRDEREEYHKLLAGRNAFLAGATALILGIVVQSSYHSIDPWLIITLVVMIVAKLVGIIRASSRY